MDARCRIAAGAIRLEWPEPCYKEIAAGVPTSTVVASSSEAAAAARAALFSTPLFRVYANVDLVGVELGGALKNVVAIASGIGDGLGWRQFQSGADDTGLARNDSLGCCPGRAGKNADGLSGMGDLFATCASPHSRNRRLGEHLARGESLGTAQHEVAQVAEGVHTTRAALRLAAEAGIELPVTQQIAEVLFEGRAPRQAVTALMQRQGGREV